MQQYFLKIVDKTVEVSFEGECEAEKSFIRQYSSYRIRQPDRQPDFRLLGRQVYQHVFMQRKNLSFVSLFHREGRKTLVFSENQSDYLNQIFFKIAMQTVIFSQNLHLVHASSSLVNGRAVLFIGKSGAGKSTIVQILRPAYVPLCDDMAILQQRKDGLFLYQIPYEEKNNYPKSNTAYPVSAIYILKKDKEAGIKHLTELQNFDYLVKMCGNLFVNGNRRRVASFVFALHDRISELSFSLAGRPSLIRKMAEHGALLK